MKKTLKTIFTTMMVVMMISLSVVPVFALGQDPSGFTGSNTANTQKMTDIGNQVITIVSVAGSLISVIVLVILGIKYMMGSAEEKAEYKKTLMPYVIGAVLIFAASVIAGAIFGFANNIQI